MSFADVNNNRTVYGLTKYTYDVLGNILKISQQDPSTTTTARERTFDYDGYGRLLSKTTPEQGTTTYSYNADDTLKTMTGPSGTTTFSYNNNRHLATFISYSPAAGFADTPTVALAYDAAGHRTSMANSNSSVTYSYNGLGQLDSEERSFGGLSGSSFTLSYVYNVGGEQTKMTSSLGPSVSYGYDEIRRAKQVTGGGWAAGESNYISTIEYRAFGAPKSISYGNMQSLALTYNPRMMLSQWRVAGVKSHVRRKCGRSGQQLGPLLRV